ncbi:histidine kinase dimerization/phospho-acceptor domain-containing protein, partial [Rubrivivax gelatinosus]|uniref:histidine kinase dimerization/phospho-acceptor domain-containing protein n=1 Tax=Rubrivivax gelatinosus TaxID=28068 RepID=UPI0028734CE4
DELVSLGRALDAMANRFQAELAARERSSQELQLARDERFVRNMSHEMRTPMNTIVLGLTHLSLQTDLSPEQRDFVDKAQGASRMMLALINDVVGPGAARGQRLQRDLAVVGDRHLGAAAAQQRRGELLVQRVVLDEQHAQAGQPGRRRRSGGRRFGRAEQAPQVFGQHRLGDEV